MMTDAKIMNLVRDGLWMQSLNPSTSQLLSQWNNDPVTGRNESYHVTARTHVIKYAFDYSVPAHPNYWPHRRVVFEFQAACHVQERLSVAAPFPENNESKIHMLLTRSSAQSSSLTFFEQSSNRNDRPRFSCC
jgi:hypothetical protein